MNINKKLILKILLNIIIGFVTLTLILSVLNLTPDNFIVLPLGEKSFETNIEFKAILKNVFDYYETLLSGTFGTSNTNKDIFNFVESSFKNSAILLSFSLFFAIVFGILKGIFDSKREKRYSSNLKTLSTLTILAMPDVFLILVLQFLAVILYRNGIKVVPAAGYGEIRHMILPILSLTLIPMSYIARITSLSIDQNFEKNYVKTALGKGASNRRIIYIHVLRNAIMDLLDSFSAIATIIISTLVVVEYMFAYPGLAYIMFKNYELGEIKVVMAMGIMIAFLYFLITTVFKILKYVLNPKLRGELN
ncbi:ABC transporter permease [Senegalia massiliensis]|uniref:ABC transporter permease subunit n=1 Tax=Senegalia massiliensis TaxID=1720316 RepID=UPI0013EF1CE4|nr:ABC transporter permease [Senegalia massiliensis]